MKEKGTQVKPSVHHIYLLKEALQDNSYSQLSFVSEKKFRACKNCTLGQNSSRKQD